MPDKNNDGALQAETPSNTAGIKAAFQDKTKAERATAFFAASVFAVFAFAATFIAALVMTLMFAMGILMVFAAFGNILGLLKNIATDLAPLTMLFAGAFGIFCALSVFCALFIFCPKLIRRFCRLREKIL